MKSSDVMQVSVVSVCVLSDSQCADVRPGIKDNIIDVYKLD